MQVKCVVVGVDEDFSYLKAAKAATYLSKKDCLFVSTNPDTGLPTPHGRIIPGSRDQSFLSDEILNFLNI